MMLPGRAVKGGGDITPPPLLTEIEYVRTACVLVSAGHSCRQSD